MHAAALTGARAFAGAMWLAAATITFQRSHKLLPSRPRLASPGLVALMIISTALMLVRGVWLGGGSAIPALLSWAFVLAGTAMATGSRFPSYAALILAASIGADVIAISLSLLGAVDLTAGAERHLLSVWELLAAGVACRRITSTLAPAEQ